MTFHSGHDIAFHLPRSAKKRACRISPMAAIDITMHQRARIAFSRRFLTIPFCLDTIQRSTMRHEIFNYLRNSCHHIPEHIRSLAPGAAHQLLGDTASKASMIPLTKAHIEKVAVKGPRKITSDRFPRFCLKSPASTPFGAIAAICHDDFTPKKKSLRRAIAI